MKTGETVAVVTIMLMPMAMAFAIAGVRKDIVRGKKVKTPVKVVAEVEIHLTEEDVVIRVKID